MGEWWRWGGRRAGEMWKNTGSAAALLAAGLITGSLNDNGPHDPYLQPGDVSLGPPLCHRGGWLD